MYRSDDSIWILDCEASGLSKQSYPIEIGVTNGFESHSWLIKPLPNWDYWDQEAQLVHNIELRELNNFGINAELVASELNLILKTVAVYCDSIQWDGFWLNVLFGSCGVTQSFELMDISSLLEPRERALSSYLHIKEELRQTNEYQLHRAEDDAKLIWKALNLARVI